MMAGQQVESVVISAAAHKQRVKRTNPQSRQSAYRAATKPDCRP